MRFVFLTLLFCALAVGCSRKTECHVELRTDEAKETSKLIKSLGGGLHDEVRRGFVQRIFAIGRRESYERTGTG